MCEDLQGYSLQHHVFERLNRVSVDFVDGSLSNYWRPALMEYCCKKLVWGYKNKCELCVGLLQNLSGNNQSIPICAPNKDLCESSQIYTGWPRILFGSKTVQLLGPLGKWGNIFQRRCLMSAFQISQIKHQQRTSVSINSGYCTWLD